MIKEDDVPALVFAYNGFYTNIFASEEFFSYEVIVDDQIVLWDENLSRERMSIGVLLELILARIDDMNSINFRYLN